MGFNYVVGVGLALDLIDIVTVRRVLTSQWTVEYVGTA